MGLKLSHVDSERFQLGLKKGYWVISLKRSLIGLTMGSTKVKLITYFISIHETYFLTSFQKSIENNMESMERHQERFSKVNQKHLEQLAAIRRGMEERLAKAAESIPEKVFYSSDDKRETAQKLKAELEDKLDSWRDQVLCL